MISDTELKQVVYAFKCNKSMLQVKGKLNTITLGKIKSGRQIFGGSVSSWGVIGVRFEEKMLHEVKETGACQCYENRKCVVIKL